MSTLYAQAFFVADPVRVSRLTGEMQAPPLGFSLRLDGLSPALVVGGMLRQIGKTRADTVTVRELFEALVKIGNPGTVDALVDAGDGEVDLDAASDDEVDLDAAAPRRQTTWSRPDAEVDLDGSEVDVDSDEEGDF